MAARMHSRSAPGCQRMPVCESWDRDTGTDGFTALSAAGGGSLNFPSIAAGGNQLIGVDQNNEQFLGAVGKGKGRKKLRLLKPKIKQLYDVEVLPAEYLGPKIEYSVNLPRVTAQLEKLMGTNVVRLTDRKYMQDLQRRIQEDYNVTLEKRISEREHEELERQKYLILNGKYSLHNCPRNLIPLHSIVLAKELERERSLILSGAGDSIPEDFNSSVFGINKKTNQIICNKREKLKTIREKNAERLIKQGLRWERERLQMEDYNRQKEIERRSRREALLEKEKLYMIEDNERALNLLRMKTRKGPCRDMDLRSLLMQQRQELGEKIKKRDFDLNDEKRMDSDRSKEKKRRHKKYSVKSAPDVPETHVSSPEEGYISMNQGETPSELETSIMLKIEKDSKDSGDESDPLDDASTVDVTDGAAGSEIDYAEAAEAEAMKEEMNKMLEKKKVKTRNEDPKITRLKEADTINEIYNIADEIIVLEKKKLKKGFGVK
ncbi:calponin homology domain-containing protein DDB_G0272472 [Toxorhynchites rutilus septentrionalis]|uniref:calponin homology domain-containing protein DDB_G0272472 n=1 Tax=Toxorhynchites rutilus septentrionalis TaxID=329112 RepID=UPI002479A87C|nr:calponin homology domain-containing protein DDB_G0272472 [Toxorhynchites rutilus septentrionalis]